MYMVVSGQHYGGKCCFDCGNAETDGHNDGDGTMEAMTFGNATSNWKTGFGTSSTSATGPIAVTRLKAGRNQFIIFTENLLQEH